MKEVPVWSALMPTDREADNGAMSARRMDVALWLQQHHPQLRIVEKAPVNWHDVYAVLVPLVSDEGAHEDLRGVVSQLGLSLGISVPC